MRIKRLGIGAALIGFGFGAFACAASNMEEEQQPATDEGELRTNETARLGEETIAPGEEEKFKEFAGEINKIQRKLEEDNRGKKRGFHAKQHACVRGEFKVLDRFDVPTELGIDPASLRVGVFAGGTYPAYARLSNASSRAEDDKESDVRGFALKLVGVNGPKLLDAERDAKTQDFLMTSRSASHVDTAEEFVTFAKSATSTISLLGWAITHPRAAARLRGQAKKNIPSLLSETYWSGAPFRLGDAHTMKYQVRPCRDLGKTFPENAGKNYLRQDFVQTLRSEDVCFNFYVQLQRDAVKQPIEKHSVVWDEEESKPVQVATFTIKKRDLEADPSYPSEEAYCDKLGFTPWHSLPAHKPLGNMNRARKVVYSASRTERAGSVQEPDGSERF